MKVTKKGTLFYFVSNTTELNQFLETQSMYSGRVSVLSKHTPIFSRINFRPLVSQ